jgi:acyl carrier protein
MSAYAAANRFLEAFAERHRSHGSVKHFCFAWSSWEDVGQTREYRSKSLPRSRGYLPMPPARALASLLVGLRSQERALLVGLDGANRHVRRYRCGRAEALMAPHVYYVGPPPGTILGALSKLEATDRFGTPSRFEPVRLEEMPLTPEGTPDLERLSLLAQGQEGQDNEILSDVEARLAAIWKSLLRVPAVRRRDSFFDLGGDSLLAGRLLGRIRSDLGVDLSLRAVLEAATLADLAGEVSRARPYGSEPDATATALESLLRRAGVDALRARLEEMSEEEVGALLEKMADEERRP